MYKSRKRKKKKEYRPIPLKIKNPYLRKLAPGELKYFDNVLANADVPIAGAIVPAAGTLVEIPQGTGDIQRDGRKITVRSIHIRSNIQNTAPLTTLIQGSYLRYMLVWDKQTNLTAPTVTAVLQTADYRSWRNIYNTQRFNILMDKTIVLSTTTAPSATTFTTQNYYLKKSFKCNIPITYNDLSVTTGPITTIPSNNIFILVISNDGQVDCAHNVRIRFSDG